MYWSGGISNPLELIELRITYLPFLRRLDDLHTTAEGCSVQLIIYRCIIASLA